VTDPEIGVILRRDAHPGARTLEELSDPLTGCRFLCDERMPLSAALAREWAEDAHLLQYRLEDETGQLVFARANKAGAPIGHQLAKIGGRIACSIVCLDHDLSGHREWSDPDEPLAWLASIPPDLQPTSWYSTLHGSRLVYVLVAPVDRLEAEGLARGLVDAWAAAVPGGLPGAASCVDWTRVFRLPRTVRSDSGQPFWLDERFYLVDGGPELDPTSMAHQVPRHDSAPSASAAPYRGGMPDEAACRAELQELGRAGRPVMTDFSREARRWLRGRESFAVAFEDAPLDPARLEDGWNNATLYYVGQVVSMLAHLDSATPEGCFALLRPALEQLSVSDIDRRDWEEIGWDMVARMWGVEEARLTDERAARDRSEETGREARLEIAAAVRVAAPEEVPGDAAGAEAWVSTRMIASDGTHHYVMRRDGSYNLSAVGDSMLIPMIRELGMEDAIPTRHLRGQKLVFRSAQDVLSEHAVPVVQVRCSARERIARVDGPDGERILRVPIHRLNPRVRPAFSADVDEWLRALFGESYGAGVDWLSHSLSTASPICALNLHGSSGSGKALLCQGLSECFEKESPNDGRAMDRFNVGLLRSPVIWCDEGVPQIRGLGSTADQVFRSLVAGGTLQIEGKMRDIIVADLYPRMVFASNDRDIMRAIVGARDLTEEDVRAIEVRLLSIHVGPDARRLLDSKGNYAHTRGWVAGDGPSRYVIANHVAFLHEHRTPSRSSSGRFLVEGETRTELVRDLCLRSDASQAVLRSLARMLDSQAARDGLHLQEGRAWVTVSCVTDYMELQSLGRNVTMPQVGQVLRRFSSDPLNPEEYVPVKQPPGAPKKGRWIELDLAAILEECLRYGMASSRVESLLRVRDGGAGATAEARVAAQAVRMR